MAHLIHQADVLNLTERCVLGRQRDCDLIVLDPKASREHCAISPKPGHGWWLENLSTSNGTRLNDEKIQQAMQLKSGDRIGIGKVQVSFYDTDPTLTTSISQRQWNRSCLLDQLFGPNRLQRILGEGPITTVYAGHQLDLDRPVAIKVFHPELVSGGLLPESTISQHTKMAGRVQDDALAAIHEYGAQDGHLWYAMELVQGENLADLVKRQGPLQVPAALVLVQRLARALGKAHAQGIVHQGLHPHCIMLTHDGRVKLLKLAIAQLELHMVHALRLRYDHNYSAPELLRGEAACPANDAYSLGCLLFFLLCGRAPYDGHSDLGKAHQTLPIPSVCRLNPALPQSVDEFIQNLLCKDPKQRLCDMELIGNDLRFLRRGKRVRSRSSDQIAVPPELLRHNSSPTESLPENRRTPLWGLIGLVCILIGLVSWLLVRQHATSAQSTIVPTPANGPHSRDLP